MPFEALRFIHASNLLVDHQLHDTGCIPEKLRETIELATTTAFEQLVSECIERNVDFLLLAGNSFALSDHSLRGRITLTDGIARLAAHSIQVFVVPGDSDPAVEWRSTDQLLANATLFLPHIDEPVAILRARSDSNPVAAIDQFDDQKKQLRVRDGKLIASIRTADQLNSAHNSITDADQSHSSRPGPFCIGLVDASYSMRTIHDHQSSPENSLNNTARVESQSVAGTEDYLIYVAGGAGLDPCRSRKIIRRPRGTQGIRSSDTGPRGCTLVEVTDDGSVRETFIPTAPVRREQPTVSIHEHTSWDRLAELMVTTIEGWGVESSEQVWLIQWNIRGFGPLFDSLDDTDAVNELIEFLNEEVQLPDDLHCVHQVQRVFDADTSDLLTDEASFASQYHRSLRLDKTLSRDELDRCLEHSELPRNPWLNRLGSVSNELDRDAIHRHLVRKGVDWFVADSTSAGH